MADTAETQRNGNGNGLVMKIALALLIMGIPAAITLWGDQRVTAAALAEHKETEEARLSELRADIRSLRDEIRGDLADIRRAVERK